MCDTPHQTQPSFSSVIMGTTNSDQYGLNMHIHQISKFLSPPREHCIVFFPGFRRLDQTVFLPDGLAVFLPDGLAVFLSYGLLRSNVAGSNVAVSLPDIFAATPM